MDIYMREACTSGYEWPLQLKHFTEVFDSFDQYIDTSTLLKIVMRFTKQEDIIVSLVTKEYLGVCKLWISTLVKTGITQYIIIAGDNESAVFLDSLNIPNCKIELQTLSDKEGFVSPTGFNEKGLAISSFKLLFVKRLIGMGFNVILSDIDALFLKRPTEDHFNKADVSFQRIVYFPVRIAEAWSFAACGGFFRFQSTDNARLFIDDVINIMRITYDDQIALNVALWESGARWYNNENNAFCNFNHTLQDRITYFKENAAYTVNGVSQVPLLKLRALSPEVFWRNDLIPFDLSKVVVFHPNSPKSESGKLEVFKKYGFDV